MTTFDDMIKPIPEWQAGYETVITEQAYAKLKAKAEGILTRLAKIYEAYEATNNEALIDSFKELCLELHRYTSLLAYADSKAYRELGDRVFGKGEMLIELAGAIAGEKSDTSPDAVRASVVKI